MDGLFEIFLPVEGLELAQRIKKAAEIFLSQPLFGAKRAHLKKMPITRNTRQAGELFISGGVFNMVLTKIIALRSNMSQAKI